MGTDPLNQGAGGSFHGGQSQHTTSNEMSAKTASNAAKVLLMLEGARLELNPLLGILEIVYPTITEDWMELYENTHVAQLSPAFTGLLEAACDDRDNSVHYLDRAINLPEFSQLAAKSFIQVITKKTPLDEDIKLKRNEITAF
jgi:hypothetical protein